MITKDISLFFSGDDCTTIKNVKGFNAAVFRFTVAIGSTVSISFNVSRNANASSVNEVVDCYNADGSIVTSTRNLEAGDYKFFVDLSGCTLFRIIKDGTFENANLNIRQDQIAFNYPTKDIKRVFSTATTLDVSTVKMLDVKLTISSLSAQNAKVRIYEPTKTVYPPIYINNSVKNDEILIGYTGIYYMKVDCRFLETLRIFCDNCVYTLEVVERKDFSEQSIDDSLQTSNNNEYIIHCEGDKQMDAEFVVSGSNGEIYTYLLGSSDGETYINIPIYDVSKNIYRGADNKMFVYNGNGKHKVYANIDGYKYIKFVSKIPTGNLTSNIKINAVTSDYVNGRKFYGGFQTINATPDKTNKLFDGYKYFKINFIEKSIVNNVETVSNIKNCSAFIGLYKAGNDMFRSNEVTVYDRGLNLISKADTIHNVYKIQLLGTPCGGGYVVKLNEPATGLAFVVNQTVGRTESSKDLAYEIECFTEQPEREKYLVKIREKNDYDIYELPSDASNRDVLNSDVIEWDGNNIIFWHCGYLGIKYIIPFEYGNIKFAYLLPFLGNNNRSDNDHIGKIDNPSRIVVFTKDKVYHNFPMPTDNIFASSDASIFAESKIFNVYKKWLPVNNKANISSTRKYFPVLSEYDYAQLNNRGIESGELIQDNLMSGINSFERLTYSSMTKDEKMCTFGNYNTEEGSEPFVMITDNGGKTWYVKSYFACTDDYAYMRGGKVSFEAISDVAPYTSNSLRMCRKRFNLPTEEIKEPETPFVINDNEKSLVSSFSVSDGTVLVTTATDIDLQGVYPIVYFENVNANSEWDYICNNGFTADGKVNNGVFFRVEKVNANTYKLYGDLGNPYEGNLVCRHIHAVNAVEAGVLISTGETYSKDKFEGGFLYLLVQNSKNGVQSWNMNGLVKDTIRLASSTNGVNRASGAYLFSDNSDPTLLYVSDASFLPNTCRFANIAGRTIDVPITPAGIYIGKLSEIDDQKKYKCVCELHTTIIGLTQSHGHFAADGHGNAIMFSKDGLNWNIDINDGSNVNGFDNEGNIYFGNKVVMFK